MSESSNTAALVDEQVEREAARIAESVVRRAPVFLEKVTGDLYETLLSEVQSYLRDNASFNIKSELSMLRATIAAKDAALKASEAREAELKRLVAMFRSRIERGGEWDDGCFYYGGTSASELQEPLNLSRAVLSTKEMGRE